MKKLLLPLLVLALGVVALLVLSAFHKETPRREAPAQSLTLDVAPALFGPERPLVEGMGRVRSVDRVQLTAEVSARILPAGFRLRNGETFRAGQTLAQLDANLATNTFRMQVSQLMAAVAEMLPEMGADLPEAAPRWRAFFDSLSLEQLPELPAWKDSREKLYLTRFRVLDLYFATRNQEELVRRHTLRAPFDGSVVGSGAVPGNQAVPGAPLAVLVRSDRMEVTLPLPASEARLLKSGMPVRLSPEGIALGIPGRIARIAQVLNDANQSVEVIVEITSHKGAGLQDGAFVQAQVEAAPLPKAFRLPRQALYQGDKVLVVEQGLLRIRDVAVAHADREFAYILSGVAQGEQVVMVPVQQVQEGLPVQVRQSEALPIRKAP